MSTQSPDSHTPLPSRMTDGRLVATLPDRAMPSLVAAVEVMVQEGVDVVSLPVAQAEQVARLRGIFGPRACFGIHDVDDDGQLREALEAGAEFVSLSGPDQELLDHCHQAGIPALVAALTPTEIRGAWRMGPAAVVVVPAEVMGSGYPEAVLPLAPGAVVTARGGLGAYAARRWAEAGAVALWLDEALIGDAFRGGPLGSLRERCQTFRAAVDEPRD
ncbi:2-dehydro-3-deoxyphosphogluconate aldolase/(4S)-4-hydroxy-2-oxoglutarate aldolase [Luteococcus japonicus]|uniref:2-dehydro-3-deoxyphosphogluconate aldolase/(4S)-4-hydroxy-2-oxoglutarate aldolase n=1 Tax=Luteococcus japonicus TaxID=33984 RepID=A0A3N1ZXJ2_9ACTN|nr:aldolase [Luteococcus japonicus]ROR55207.1 2-dehydro-3-deoxyphosphogluconate aldolase/(4S)-4-hydroxy-2-oxoglutarate aldolase [Luteococcus japonicus]